LQKSFPESKRRIEVGARERDLLKVGKVVVKVVVKEGTLLLLLLLLDPPPIIIFEW
jgi:hypothetical protein